MNTTAKLHYPPKSFQLKNEQRATIRAIHPDDAPRLQAFVDRLSPESIYYRFLSTITGLSDAEATRLANVDYEDRMALVVTVLGDDGQLIIAVARYARSAPESDRAEFAIVVEDQYQGNGLGRFLIQQLANYAYARGVRTFTGTIISTNERMKNFLQSIGLPVHMSVGDPGELNVEIDATQTK